MFVVQKLKYLIKPKNVEFVNKIFCHFIAQAKWREIYVTHEN